MEVPAGAGIYRAGKRLWVTDPPTCWQRRNRSDYFQLYLFGISSVGIGTHGRSPSIGTR
jgi:hypothetical protein